MKKQLLLIPIFLFFAVSLCAQFYVRGIQDPVGPCDWGNTNSSCEMTDPDGDGKYCITLTTSNTEFKVYNSSTDTWFPITGAASNAWTPNNQLVTVCFNSATGSVEIDDAQSYSFCAPGDFNSWVNTQAMTNTTGNVWCYVIPNAGLYAWKPTQCGTWYSWESESGERATTPGNWEVTTTGANQQLCVEYEPSTGLMLPFMALPVELISFKAELQESNVLVSWTTLSETDNEVFNLERSSDGVHFETVGLIEGAGNSSVKNDYRFIDEEPMDAMNYYRLKQIDFDGKIEFSNIVSVVVKDKTTTHLFPNPAKEKITIATDLEEAQIEIYNINGQLVHVSNQSIENQLDVDISNFQTGIYFLQMKNNAGNILFTDRFVKK